MKDTVTLFVDDLTVIDFSYLDKDRGMVGESFNASIKLTGTLDDEGVIFDFSLCKKAIKTWIDDHVDHRLIVPTLSTAVGIKNDDRTHLVFSYANGIMEYSCPDEGVCMLPDAVVTEFSLSKFIAEQLKNVMPENVIKVGVELTPTPHTLGALAPYKSYHYHYSHGLKKHYGNCQRLSHGHRSPIHITKNGKLDLVAMEAWSNTFNDVFIGQHEDLVRKKCTDLSYFFEYTSIQGKFSLLIPKSHCYLMEDDTTVENISRHIYEDCAKSNPNDKIMVQAFEGIGKGSITE